MSDNFIGDILLVCQMSDNFIGDILLVCQMSDNFIGDFMAMMDVMTREIDKSHKTWCFMFVFLFNLKNNNKSRSSCCRS